MTPEASILTRLAAIEEQNQQVLLLLAKLAGGETPPQVRGGISTSRRMEIIQMAYDAATKLPRKKKPSNREARV
ncbi:MAG: hypothetical protein NT087_10165 [Deltaproteobacteria bacterium]|nr:hypothetical protein [Deltaproteobacteria bacterium]